MEQSSQYAPVSYCHAVFPLCIPCYQFRPEPQVSLSVVLHLWCDSKVCGPLSSLGSENKFTNQGNRGITSRYCRQETYCIQTATRWKSLTQCCVINSMLLHYLHSIFWVHKCFPSTWSALQVPGISDVAGASSLARNGRFFSGTAAKTTHPKDCLLSSH